MMLLPRAHRRRRGTVRLERSCGTQEPSSQCSAIITQRNCRDSGTARVQRGSLHTSSVEGEDNMLMKSIVAGLAGTALLATVAFAQSPTATTDKAPTAATTTTTTTSGEWRTSKMSGLKV